MTAAAMMAFASPLSAAERLGFGADYELFLAGLHLLDISLETTVVDGSYTTRVNGAPQGLARRLLPWSLAATSDGTVEEGRLTPRRARSARTWRGKETRLEIEFADGGPAAMTAEPPRDGDGLRKIPRAQLTGSADLLSAINSVIVSNATGPLCREREAVFDGRRRFDMVLEPLPPLVLKAGKPSHYAGPAEGCRLTFEYVAGKTPSGNMSGNPLFAWFARLPGDGPMVPVRLEMRTRYGLALMHLKRLRRADGTLAFGGEVAPQAAERR